MSTPQQQVYYAVQTRGYTDGWTDGQFFLRQIAKLVEELHEVIEQAPMAQYTKVLDFVYPMQDAAAAARVAFDAVDVWEIDGTLGARRPKDLMKELADCQVVLLCAAQALQRMSGVPFDVVQAAVGKATADVSRGVRGAQS